MAHVVHASRSRIRSIARECAFHRRLFSAPFSSPPFLPCSVFLCSSACCSLYLSLLSSLSYDSIPVDCYTRRELCCCCSFMDVTWTLVCWISSSFNMLRTSFFSISHFLEMSKWSGVSFMCLASLHDALICEGDLPCSDMVLWVTSQAPGPFCAEC